jgi:imidazolonepropionase-like amidohydrolase
MKRTTLVRIAIAVLLALSAGAAPQAQERVIALRAAWVIDATGRAPIADGIVLVKGNRIDAVGTRATVTVPAGAQVIDLPGQTLLPGLIDTHSHLSNWSMYPSLFGGLGQRRAPATEQMIKMVRDARVQLLCGITTLRQCGEPGMTDVTLKQAIEGGVHPGPRIISAGEHIGPELDTADAIRKKVGDYFRAGAEWIKMTHGDLTPTAAQISPALMKAGVDEAHHYGLKVTVHAVGRWGSAVRTAVEAGADNIEHVRPMSDEILQLMVKHGTTASFTPIAYIGGWYPRPEAYDTMVRGVNSGSEWMDYLDREISGYLKAHPEAITTDLPFESPASDLEPWRASRDMYEALKTVQRQIRRAQEIGLPFSLGLDSRYGGQAWQLQFLVEGGIAPMDALRSATSVAATLIGYGDRIGTIEKGKLADLISVQGNPVQDIKVMRQIRLVMRDGIRYDTLSWR